MHAHGVANNSNRPENMSVMPDLPARGAEPHTGKPERPESQMDVSDTHTQGISNDPRGPVDASDMVKTPLDNWIKSNLPVIRPKSHPGKLQTQKLCRCIGWMHTHIEHSS